jgi:hypothetical protein
MIDVAAGAVGEERDHVRPLVFGQAAGQRRGIIGRELRAPDGVRMHGKVHAGRQRLGRRVPRYRLEINHAHFRINRPGDADDVRVQLAGIPADRTVAHVEAAVEADVWLQHHGGGGARWLQPFRSPPHAFGDERGQAVGILHRHLRIFAERVVSQAAFGQHRPGVRVRGADHHVRAGNAGGPLDLTSRCLDHWARGGDQIKCDERGPGSTNLEDKCLGEEIVIRPVRAALEVVAGQPDAGRGRDVDARGSGAKFHRAKLQAPGSKHQKSSKDQAPANFVSPFTAHKASAP